MARSQFTFTFPNAQPGASVTFSAAVYSSPVDASADGPTLLLDSLRSVAVWTDAAELTATWVDGAGVSIMAEASAAHPVVTGQGGTPGQHIAASGATLLAYTATGADFSGVGEPFALTGSAGSPVATPTVGDWGAVGVGSPVACAALTAGVYLARLQWFESTGIDFAGAYVYAGTIHGNDVMPLYLSPLVGQSSSTYAHFALSADDVVYVAGGANNPEASRVIDLTLTFVKVADFL